MNSHYYFCRPVHSIAVTLVHGESPACILDQELTTCTAVVGFMLAGRTPFTALASTQLWELLCTGSLYRRVSANTFNPQCCRYKNIRIIHRHVYTRYRIFPATYDMYPVPCRISTCYQACSLNVMRRVDLDLLVC